MLSGGGGFEAGSGVDKGMFGAGLGGGEDAGPVGGIGELAEGVHVEPRGRGGAGGVEGGGGPGEGGGVVNHAGTEGVALDVAEGGEEVAETEDAGVVAGLPEAAFADEAAVEVGGVAAVDALHEAGDVAGVGGAGEDVVVVGHEAVCEDADLAELGVFGDELEEDAAISVGVEGWLAVVAALGEVEVVAWRGETRFSGHVSSY